MSQRGNKILFIGFVFILAGFLTACSKPEERVGSLMTQAQASYDKGNYEMAKVFAREILDQDQQNWHAAFLTGRIALKQNDQQTAAQAFSRTLALKPDHRDAQLALAELLLANRQYDQSRSYIEHLLKTDPQDYDALILKCQLLLAQKQLEQAQNLLTELKDTGKNQPQVYVLLASAKAQQQDTDAAEQVLQEGLHNYPNDVSLRLALARLFSQTQRANQATEELQRIMDLEPETISYPLMLADLSWQGGKVEKAEEVLTKIISDDPQSADRRLQVADFYMKHKQSEKAGNVLQEAVNAIPANAKLYLALSRYYQMTGQSGKAIETLLACLGQKPKPEKAELQAVHLALAQAYYLRQEIDPALNQIEKVLAENPEHLDAIFLKGRIATSRGEIDQAISAFQAVLAKRPNQAQAYLQLAQAYMLAGNIPSATTVLFQGAQQLPASKKMHLALARAFMAHKDYKGAESELLKVLKIDPADYKVQAELGDFYAQLKDTHQAEREYAEIVSKFPEIALGYIKLASLYANQQLPSKAITELRRGYRRNRQSNDLLLALVRAYLQTENTEAAVKLCKKRLDGNDKDPFAHNLMGRIHEHLKQYPQAEQSYKRAVELAPKWNEPSNNWAALMLKTGRKTEAIQRLEAGLQQNPRNSAAYLTLAQLNEEQADYKAAAKYYEQGLANIPQFGEAAFRLARLLSYTGDSEPELERALHLAMQAYQNSPGRADIVDTLGWIYHQCGDDIRAAKLLQLVVDQLPESPSVNYHLAMVLLKEGKTEQARNHLETALKSKDSRFIGRAEAEQALKTIKKAG